MNSKLRKEVTRATRLYKSFRERSPKRARVIYKKIPRVLVVIGHVDAILYRTTHNGVLHKYEHPFRAGSKPLLCTGTRDNQLYLIGGRYRFTGRGTVDLDSRRREQE